MTSDEIDGYARAGGYDAELRRHNEILQRAGGVRGTDHVLDIGCGTGQTSRDAARVALAGSVLGVDISASAIARAHGPGNVTFECADAQTFPFPRDHFDLAISRFGTMFFDDPVAAFTNIARALRPAGRLVMMVWQARERNEWAVAIHEALGGEAGPAAFSLADPRDVLAAAGFTDVTLTDVHEPVYYGSDVAAAFAWVRGFADVREALLRHGPAFEARLREVLTAHLGDDGVRFDSRAWLVTARRRTASSR